MGLVTQLVGQKTGYLEVKGSSPFETCANPYFSSMYAGASLGELYSQEILIHQKHFCGNTLLTVHNPWQEGH